MLASALRELTASPLPPLFPLGEGPEPGPSAGVYLEHYGLAFPGVTHAFGRFESRRRRLAGHVFLPGEPRGTVIVLHGYYDHVGVHSRLIRFLLETGHAVAAYDMPGHGLSSGRRASVEDFGDLVTAQDDFVALARQNLPGPHHFVGHSTGAAVALDHVLTSEDVAFDQVVLLAPLVRSYAWNLSRLGNWMVRPFTDEVPRVFRANSSDADFLEFVESDPLQYRRVPLAYAAAVQAWNGRLQGYPPSEKEVVVIQGTRDTTVDWKHNVGFLRGKLPRARIELIEGGRHHLANESAELRTKVYDVIESVLA